MQMHYFMLVCIIYLHVYLAIKIPDKEYPTPIHIPHSKLLSVNVVVQTVK